ncbi:MAG: molybdopterin-synthase adenylyltransferase MoeB, partial [Longimicrobiales bacterium]|nr:molybdopterin-synthase adenylyltransferase MoeB [Longimicrobiales bacterium]
MPNDRPLPDLSPDELLRYSRHFPLPQVGVEGQRRLKAARVLLVGMGGLGSPLGLYLAAAGVGTLGLVDDDVVDASNLQRQVMHGTKDLGRAKLASALDRLADVNPHVELVPHAVRLDASNAMEILGDYDIVVDGTDNFPTRYLINDACVLLGIPYVYGSILRFDGQVALFAAEGGPCYRCLFRDPPPPGLVPNCAEGGVLGVLPGIVGSFQALEVIKWILGAGESSVGKLRLLDALDLSWRTLTIDRDPECPVCGDAPTVTELIDYETFCGVDASGAALDSGAGGEEVPGISAPELARRLDAGEAITLIDVREPHEWEIMNLADRGARLVPLGEIVEAADELRDTPGEVVLHCKSGARSRDAAIRLREVGVHAVM